MPFGYADTQYVDLPALMDRSYVESLVLDSGMDFSTVLAAVDDRLTAFNGTQDALVALLSTQTREAFIEYMQSRKFVLTPKGEYGLARPQKGHDAGGHMLPLNKWEVAIGWTEDGLRQMRLAAIEANIDSMLAGFRAQFRYDTLMRLFSDDELPVELGVTTATSPGFAGSGTGLNVYSRPYPNGAALPGGYTHYVRADDAGRPAALIAAAAKLRKQGHLPPYDLITNDTQLALIMADTTNFIGVGSALVRPAPSAAEALVDASTYVGVYAGVIQVRYAVDEIASNNIAVFKTYGAGNDRNPLVVRYPDLNGLPDNGKAVYVRSRNLYPLAEATALGAWGVGVNDRTAAVLLYINASGNYVDATISL